MLLHNPECTNGGAHPYTACRDRSNQPLKMLEVPDPVAEGPSEPESGSQAPQEPKDLGQLTPEDRATLEAAMKAIGTIHEAEPALEAAARAFGGLVHPQDPADVLPGVNRMDLSAHNPHANPDGDADAATRGE